MEDLIIRKATIDDDEVLSHIALMGKMHWNYPESYFKIWEKELLITKEYISLNTVFVAVVKNEVIGFYSIIKIEEDFMADEVFVKKGFWLEHIFILPGFHKMGIGTKLMKHAISYCKENDIDKLQVFVEPYSVGFYDKIGGEYIADSPSSIKDRYVPLYEINIKK